MKTFWRDQGAWVEWLCWVSVAQGALRIFLWCVGA